MATPARTSAATALVAIGGAFVTGVLIAKCVDWIGHGHPRH
ncbi:MAG TPA: hypothetical protein VFJ77_09820 [Gaiellaceae bacterium]|nr:hypothetical protein [Gaiellaceae bacterium]